MIEFVAESPLIDARYVCNLCDKKFDINSFIAHCTGAKHRLNYLVSMATVTMDSVIAHCTGAKHRLNYLVSMATVTMDSLIAHCTGANLC